MFNVARIAFDTDNRRISPRTTIRGTAAYLSNHRIVIARSADVSLTGAFIQTKNPDPVGTRGSLRLVHGGESHTFETEAVRVSFASNPDGTGMGMGLRFFELSKIEKKFIARYVAASR